MRFIDLYEETNKDAVNKQNTEENKEQNKKQGSEKKDNVVNSEADINYYINIFKKAFKTSKSSDIIHALNCIVINGRDSQAKKDAGIALKDPENENSKVITINYTRPGTSETTSEFDKLRGVIISNTKWEELINNCITSVKDNSNKNKEADLQNLIKNYFIPKLKNPRQSLIKGSKNNNRLGDANAYEKFGKCLVFFSAKCTSRLTDINTKINANQFKMIMQGVFGAMGNAGNEDESFLEQFSTIKEKMEIDAAKNVINNISNAGNNDLKDKGVKTNSNDDFDENKKYDYNNNFIFDSLNYYNAVSKLLKNLNEAEEQEDNTVKEGSNKIKFPNAVSDFSNNVKIAHKQAMFVAHKFPHDYKIEYDKLQAGFDAGVKDYQDKLRKLSSDNEMGAAGKITLMNPLTGNEEVLNGRAWGMGGPNAYINNHPWLKKHVDNIKNQKPITIYNIGPKFIFGIFDMLEKGGKAFQTFCDGMAEGFKQMRRSFRKIKPEDFEQQIKESIKNNNPGEVATHGTFYILWAWEGLIDVLSGNKDDLPIATLDCNNYTYNSSTINNVDAVAYYIDALKNAIKTFTDNVEPEYLEKFEEITKELNEKEKQAKSDLDQLNKGEIPEHLKNNDNDGNSNKGEDDEEESSNDEVFEKNPSEKANDQSNFKVIQKNRLINEDEKADAKKKEIEKHIDNTKKIIENLGKTKDEKLGLKLDIYAELLTSYKNSLAHVNDIEKVYNILKEIFPISDNGDIEEADIDEFFLNEENSSEENSDNEEQDNEEQESEQGSNNTENSTSTVQEQKNSDVKENTTLHQDNFQHTVYNALIEYLHNNDKIINENENNEQQENQPKDENENNNDNADDKKEYIINENVAKSYLGLLKSFQLFSNDTGKSVNDVFDMGKIYGLSSASSVQEGMKKFNEVFKSLLTNLQNIQINKIENGLVLINNEKVKNYPSESFKVILKGQEADSNDKSDQEKDDDNKNEEKPKTEVDVLEEYNKALENDVGENGILIKYVKNLNNIVRQSSGDNWIKDVFDKNVNYLQEHINKRFEDFKQMYQDENASKWLDERKKELDTYTYSMKIWAAISIFKYIHEAIKKQIENTKKKAESTHLSNKHYLPFIEPKIYNKKNKFIILEDNHQNVNYSKDEIEKFTKEVANTISSINFVEKLGLSENPGDKIYNITDSNIVNAINDKETKLANDFFNTKNGNTVSGKNGDPTKNLIGRIRYLAFNDNSPYKAKIKSECPALLAIINPVNANDLDKEAMAKGNKTKNDRDIIRIAGAIHGICVTINKLSAEQPSNNNDSNNDGKPANDSNSNSNNTDSTSSNIAPESFDIRAISDNTLINEIYKYIIEG